MSPIKIVVVHGATGQQGGSAVRALSSAGFQVLAAVRDADAPKARELGALPGVQLVVVDLEDLDSLIAAYNGADAVYSCTVPGKDEAAHGKRMADAAKAAGVRLHVFSALQSISKITNGELKAQNFDDKGTVVEYILSLGIPATFLYLGAFMENYVNYPGYSSVEDGTIVIRYGSSLTNKKLPLVRTTKDVGEVVKIIVSYPDEFVGQHVGLGNVPLTVEEQAKIIEQVSGHKARGEQGPPVPASFGPFAESANNLYKFGNDDRWDGMFTGMTMPNPLLEKYGFKPASFESFVREALIPHLKL